VKKDPRLETTPEEYAKQLSLSLQVRDKLSETNDAVIRIRELRKQLDEYAKRDAKKVADAAKALTQKLTEVEEALYQTRNRASEDPLNYPIKLNNKLAHVLGVVQSSDNQPTQQSYMVYEDLATQVNAELKKLDGLMGGELAAFNKLIRDENVPAVQAPARKAGK
jgi:sensor c-di-GMP phosphodiesterase-like protein